MIEPIADPATWHLEEEKVAARMREAVSGLSRLFLPLFGA